MAYCGKCGGEVQTGVAFCPKCGQAQTGVESTATSQNVQGMAENVAGSLCYLLGWITGIIFFLIDKRPYVRFHAAQSIVVFGGLHVLSFVAGIIFGVGFMMSGRLGGFGLGYALYSLISLVALVLWIVLMVKASQGEKFQVPVAAGIATSFAGK